ncbi:MAG: WD40 repeat domain-containing protein [Aureispira sp.]|nr:WD40 repeat domain-containing protein [Aureispira sp.]
MNLLYKSILSTLLLLTIISAKAQNTQVPFVSDHYDLIPILSDNLSELKLIATWGDSRWFHPRTPTAGDIRYAAHDSIIIIGGGDYITAWEAQTGVLLWEYRFDHKRGYSNMTRSLSISNTKPWVMAANDGNGLFIFNYYTGQLVKKFEHKDQFVFGAMSPNGKWAAAHTYNLGWKLWDVESGEQKYGTTDKISALTFSPDSKHLAISTPLGDIKYKLTLIELKSGETDRLQLGLNDEMRQCQSLQYSPDGKLIAMGFWGGTAAVWDLENQKFLFKEKVDASWVDGLSFTKGGKRLLILGASNIHIWEQKDNSLSEWKPTVEASRHTWEDGSWSQDGEHIILACRQWQRPRRFKSTKMATELYLTNSLRSSPPKLAFSANSKYLAASRSRDDAYTLFWDIDNKDSLNKLSQKWTNHSINLASVTYMNITPSLPSPVAKWHDAPSSLLCEHHFGSFTKDRAYYAGIGNDRVIYIYDGKTGKPLAGKSTQGILMEAVVISPDGNYLAAAGWDGLIRLYQVPNLK